MNENQSLFYFRCVAKNSFINKTLITPPASLTMVKSSRPSSFLEFVADDSGMDSFDNGSQPLRIRNVTVLYNENVLLSCAVSGKPKAKVTWNFQPDLSDYEEKEIKSMELFLIHNVSEENSGLYTCTASNGEQSIQQVWK